MYIWFAVCKHECPEFDAREYTNVKNYENFGEIFIPNLKIKLSVYIFFKLKTNVCMRFNNHTGEYIS